MSVCEGRLTLDAQSVGWAQVFDQVGKVTGTRFHVFIELPGPISIAFRNLPAVQALERLLGSETSYVLRFPDSDAALATAFPTDVWVLSWGPLSASSFSGAQALPSPVVAAAAGAIDEVDKVFASDPQAAREAALSASSPQMRRRAILYFGWRADEEALDVLAQVLEDRDPVVRGQAVDALELFVDQPGMRRSALQVLGRSVDQHPRVREVLVHVMKTAEEAEVRHLAARSLGVPVDVVTPRTLVPRSHGPTAR